MANAERPKVTTIMKKRDDNMNVNSDKSSSRGLINGVCGEGGDNDVDLAAENSSKRMSSTMREGNKENEIPSPPWLKQQDGILNAIINKQSVSLRVSPTSSSSPDHDKELCGNGCNCATPIIEIIDDDDVDDEIASAYDVNVDAELVDTSYEYDDDVEDESFTDMRTEKKNQIEVNTLDEFILSNEDATSINTDSDDSSTIDLVRSKTSKRRVFIVDSDDDEEEDDGIIPSVAHGSPKKDDQIVDTDFSVDESSKQYDKSSLSIDKSKVDDSNEQEWIELSSDEEDEASPPLKRVNKVVILSDDEEDEDESINTGQNDDDHSAFTISDDSNDSDNSSIRDRTIRKHVKPITDKPRSTATFRKNRDTITSQTFAEFNKQVFHGALSSVIVTWSKKLNKTAGITRMRGKLGDGNGHTRVAAIELSTKVIDDEERLRSTLLHEMCHAAQWCVDGVPKPPHGAIFKKWASKSMSKISDVEVTTTHNYQIAYKFAWVSLNPTTIIAITFVLTLTLESL